ncbi:MAG: DUF4350 domain-containing protein [Acidobacteriaceae bacterium]|nr:DUF4350 domain-containing protein [Acidobacteriaceae bacterium]
MSRTDRNLLLGAALLAVLMAAATVAFAPARPEEETSVPSTYSSTSGGARAAFLLLEQLHYRVRRWEDSPRRLTGMNEHAVLILAEPAQFPVDPERDALLRFVKNGGRVLFCGPLVREFFGGSSVFDYYPGREWKQFSPDLPSPFTRGAQRISIDPRTSWRLIRAKQLGLYGGKRPVVVAWSIGKGELLWWAAATPLTNTGLDKEDNLVLFLNAVSVAGNEAPREIYWDEYFHGERASLWSYLAKTPVKWGMVQFGVVLAAVLFTFSRRWGPVVAPRAESRLSPLEFVDTLGALYRHAGAASVAVAVAHRHLRLALTRSLALPAGIEDAALARAAGQRLGWDLSHLSATLEGAARAQNRKTRARDVLTLVQDMTRYSNLLASSRRGLEKR